MNVARLVASIGGYFYSTGDDLVAVHLYGGNSAKLTVGNRKVAIRQEADYPWSGKIRIAVDPEAASEFSIWLRIPGWAQGETLAVNGQPVATATRRHGYVEIKRRWAAGDVIDLNLPMPPTRIFANPNVRMDGGRVALKRGPLVYCLEQVDNKEPVPRLRLPRDARIEAVQRKDLFDGVVSLVADGKALDEGGWGDTLYRANPPAADSAKVTAIPYYLWANREPGRMLVWIPEG
jgi:hypothetical protein